MSGTDFNLLKWKFAHLNSVDFLLRSTPAGADLYLLETRRDKPLRGLQPLPGVTTEDCPCSWDAHLH